MYFNASVENCRVQFGTMSKIALFTMVSINQKKENIKLINLRDIEETYSGKKQKSDGIYVIKNLSKETSNTYISLGLQQIF